MSWPAVAAWFAGTIAAVSANFISLAMIGKINARVLEHERVSYVFWGWEVRSRFKRLFPDSKLILVLDASVILMIVSFCALVKLWVLAE